MRQTFAFSTADAGTFSTIEGSHKSVRMQNRRKRDAKSIFTEDEDAHTVFWSNFSRTRNTKLKGSFTLPNCVKTFRVSVMGVDSAGTYGIFTSWLTVQKLFNVVVKTPPFIRTREEVECVLSMENNQPGDLHVEIPRFKERVDIPQGSLMNYKFEIAPEDIPYKLRIIDGSTREKIFRKVEIPVYRGLCFEGSHTMQVRIRGGRVSDDEVQLSLPRDLIANTTRIRLEYKQVGIDVLMRGVENFMQQPNGGLEHTCSVAFSLVMLIQYLRNLPKKPQHLVNMQIFAEERLDETLAKLDTFECKGGGFEMFGTGEGDVTLSAYVVWVLSEALLLKGFKDKTLLERTLQWLRNQYKETEVKFNMKRDSRPGQALPSQFRSDLYIMFVLTLLRDRFADYRTIVHHKVDDYDMLEKKVRMDSYLRSLFAMIYFGKAPGNPSPGQEEEDLCDDGGLGEGAGARRLLLEGAPDDHVLAGPVANHRNHESGVDGHDEGRLLEVERQRGTRRAVPDVQDGAGPLRVLAGVGAGVQCVDRVPGPGRAGEGLPAVPSEGQRGGAPHSNRRPAADPQQQ